MAKVQINFEKTHEEEDKIVLFLLLSSKTSNFANRYVVYTGFPYNLQAKTGHLLTVFSGTSKKRN